jgi:hypothetical protein
MSLFTPSGGLVYHLRAARYRAGLWAPFRAAVEHWLDAQLGSGEELVLVGPSGGHCLPERVVKRFGRVLALEPDPVARLLLRARLRGLRLELESRDLLVEPLLTSAPGLDQLLQARPGAAVLFCNVLGQLHFGLSDEQQQRFRRAFRERIVPALSGRVWASFHDRWSLDRDRHEQSAQRAAFDGLPSDRALGQAWFGEEGATVTVLDHETSELFPSTWPRHYFAWQITPGALHVVEGVSGT